MAAWSELLAGVRGVLLDISGVLYDGGEGGGAAITGSVEAVARLKRSRLKVRFCTNESQKSQVRTGKFRPSDEHHPEVKADGYVDNLAEAVDLLLQHANK